MPRDTDVMRVKRSDSVSRATKYEWNETTQPRGQKSMGYLYLRVRHVRMFVSVHAVRG